MKHIFTILLTLACAIGIHAQETAEQVVDRFIRQLEQEALQTSFRIVITEQGADPMTYNGHIVMQGERFVLNMFGTEAAYDGQTLYMYSPDTDEMTLSTPTQQELVDANPLLFAKAMRTACSLRFSTAQQPDLFSIDFIPVDQSAGIQRFVLRCNKHTLAPIEIQIREQQQQKRTTLSFVSPKFERTTSDFTLHKPDAFLNDLR